MQSNAMSTVSRQTISVFFKGILVTLLVISTTAYGLFMFGVAFTLRLGPFLVLQVIADERREMILGPGTWVICAMFGFLVILARMMLFTGRPQD
jgi:hypothetical protein